MANQEKKQQQQQNSNETKKKTNDKRNWNLSVKTQLAIIRI